MKFLFRLIFDFIFLSLSLFIIVLAVPNKTFIIVILFFVALLRAGNFVWIDRKIFKSVSKLFGFFLCLSIVALWFLPLIFFWHINKVILIVYSVFSTLVIFKPLYLKNLSRKTLVKMCLIGLYLLTLAVGIDLYFVNRSTNCSDISDFPYLKPIYLYHDHSFRELCGEFYESLSFHVREIVMDPEEENIYVTYGISLIHMDPVYTIRRFRPEYPCIHQHIIGQMSEGIVYNNKRNKIYVTFPANNKVMVFTDYLQPTNEVYLVGKHPNQVIIDDEKDVMWVLNHEGGSIQAYHLESQKDVGRLNFDSMIFFIVRNSKIQRLYALSLINWINGKTNELLFEIDEDSLEIIRSFSLEGRKVIGFDIALDETDNTIFISLPMWSKVLVIDGNEFKLKGEMTGEFGETYLLFDEIRRLLYVGNYFSGTLKMYDIKDYSLKGQVFVGKMPRALYLTPKTNRLFVGSACGMFEVDVNAMLSPL